MDYTVKLERYEGPYTKLLSLIEERKLSITEINLGSLADDYIEYIKSKEEKDHMDMSLFIVVASTLMLMKVKSLLPKREYVTAEEKQIEDLTNKLLLFSYLEEASRGLASKVRPKKVFFSYGKTRLKKITTFMPRSLTPSALRMIGEEMLRHAYKEETIRDIAIRKKTSIEEVTELFRKTERGRFSLKEISAEVSDEKALLLSFISLLELIRLGEYSATQETRDDIFIIKSVMIHS